MGKQGIITRIYHNDRDKTIFREEIKIKEFLIMIFEYDANKKVIKKLYYPNLGLNNKTIKETFDIHGNTINRISLPYYATA